MATKLKDKSITNMFGSIAAAQTMVEHFPLFIGVSESGFTCSFDLLTTIFNLCSDVPLKDMVINHLVENIGDSNCTWLQSIEDVVKEALQLNLTNMLTCEMSPIISDNLIGGATFIAGGEQALPFSSEGITIPVSSLDFIGMLKNCPADETSSAARSNYMSCYVSGTENTDNPQLLGVTDLWKHDDFNAFLWYVKNKGVYGNIEERNKLMWDNRYKTKPFTKYERKPEHFFTKGGVTLDGISYNGQVGLVPFDADYLNAYNNSTNTRYKKKQILECRYIDGDGVHSDSFQFRLAASNYYKTRRLTGKNSESKILKINKTIFEFNHDFLMSLKLYDAKTYLAQITHTVLGEGNLSFNFSVTHNNEILEEMIETITNKVIASDDLNIDDCFFTFSNDEYNEMIQNVITTRRTGLNNAEMVDGYLNEIENLDKVSENVRKENLRGVISGITTNLSETEVSTTAAKRNKLQFNYNYELELLRLLVYPLIRPLFTPKVIALLMINLHVMGNPLEDIDFDKILPYLMSLIKSVILKIKDIIVEILYSWVIEKLTPILALFSLRLIMEQLDAYRKLIENLLIACMGVIPNFKRKLIGTNIDTVNYVEIDPAENELKKIPISNSNC